MGRMMFGVLALLLGAAAAGGAYYLATRPAQASEAPPGPGAPPRQPPGQVIVSASTNPLMDILHPRRATEAEYSKYEKNWPGNTSELPGYWPQNSVTFDNIGWWYRSGGDWETAAPVDGRKLLLLGWPVVTMDRATIAQVQQNEFDNWLKLTGVATFDPKNPHTNDGQHLVMLDKYGLWGWPNVSYAKQTADVELYRAKAIAKHGDNNDARKETWSYANWRWGWSIRQIYVGFLPPSFISEKVDIGMLVFNFFKNFAALVGAVLTGGPKAAAAVFAAMTVETVTRGS